MLVRIADVTIEIIGDDPGIDLCLDGPIEGFRVGEGQPDVRIRASWCEPPGRPEGREVFDSGGVWRLYFHDGRFRFELTSPRLGGRPYAVALFTPEFTSGEVRLTRTFFDTRKPVYPLQYPLDELLMLHLLALGRGVQVHACGLAGPNGRTYLFVGESGAGKTTMARLWEGTEGVTILSDDRIILREVDGEFWMYGTPWHGEGCFGASVRAPLHQIFFLRHGRQNECVPKAGAEAAARLFAGAFPVFHDRTGLEFSLAFCEAATRSAPCHELLYVPDRRILEFLQQPPAA